MSVRDLPSVDALARSLDGNGIPDPLVIEVARAAIADARTRIANGEKADAVAIAQGHLQTLAKGRLQELINATGVLLHTNLGRAPWSPSAVAAAAKVATGYSNVEFDLAAGGRGTRSGYIGELLASLTGAETGMVANNNAGGLFLALTALGKRRQVVVSRGELIEIGGSYRLPELMVAAGVKLLEVGTTNRTRVSDYRNALSEKPALLLKVHPSNYRIQGFTESVAIGELVALQSGLPVLFDVGSGLLDETTPWLGPQHHSWLTGEPGVKQAVEAGADLVFFSGDKLLGGPQAGVIVGRRDLIEKLAKHPVARALRLDAAGLAALTATLDSYANGSAADLPFWRMATTSAADLKDRYQKLIQSSAVRGEIQQDASTVGAGSVPGAEIKGPVLVIEHPPADVIFERLLGGHPPVVARRRQGSLILDLRSVPSERDGEVSAALAMACRS